MGTLNNHGIDEAGSAVEVEIIPPTLVPVGNKAFITEFGCSQQQGAAHGVVKLQKSEDDFNADIKELERMVVVGEEKIHLTYLSGLTVPSGAKYRVLFYQGTPGPITVTLGGTTQGQNGGVNIGA